MRLSACGTVIYESQRPNFSQYSCYLLDFKAILCFNWSLHCTVVFAQKDTSPFDATFIFNLRRLMEPGLNLDTLRLKCMQLRVSARTKDSPGA